MSNTNPSSPRKASRAKSQQAPIASMGVRAVGETETQQRPSTLMRLDLHQSPRVVGATAIMKVSRTTNVNDTTGGRDGIKTDDEEGNKPPPTGDKNTFYAACLTTLLLTVNAGHLDSWTRYQSANFTSSLEDKQDNDMITLETINLLRASYNVGQSLGAVVAGHMMYHLGRKKIMSAAATVMVIMTCSFKVISSSLAMQSILSLTMGIPAGAVKLVVPHYIIEVAPVSYRPNMAGYFVASHVLGELYIDLIWETVDSFETRSIFYLACGITPAAYILLDFRGYVLESPRWLYWKGQRDKAKEAFQMLYRDFPPPDKYPYPSVSAMDIATLISTLATLCILSFTDGVIRYTNGILFMDEKKDSLTDVFARMMSIILACVFAVILGRYFSHKILVCTSTLISMSLIGVYAVYLQRSDDQKLWEVLCGLGVTGALAAAFLPTYYLKTTVLFPMVNKNHICATPAAIASTTVALMPYLANLSKHVVVILSCIATILTCVTILRFIPETQRMSLEQIFNKPLEVSNINVPNKPAAPLKDPLQAIKPRSMLFFGSTPRAKINTQK